MQHLLVFQNLDYSKHSLLSSFATAEHCYEHHAHLAKIMACPTVTAVAAEVFDQSMSKLSLNLAASSFRTLFATSMRLVLSYLPSGGPYGLTIESVFVGGKCYSVLDLAFGLRHALTKLALRSQLYCLVENRAGLGC